jgi:hypothetical protein
MIVVFCILLWLVPSVLIWMFSRWLRTTSPPGEVASWAFVRGVAVGCFIAPSIVSGGYAAMPAPAVLGLLTSVFAQHVVLWDQFLISFGSLVLCSLIAFVIIYATAKPNQAAPPNGGPATRSGNSEVSGGAAIGELMR